MAAFLYAAAGRVRTMESNLVERRREARARRLARRANCSLHKSRTRLSINNYGDFMIVDDQNFVVAGADFDLTLDDVEEWLSG
jgi:hypothetical protein